MHDEYPKFDFDYVNKELERLHLLMSYDLDEIQQATILALIVRLNEEYFLSKVYIKHEPINLEGIL